MEPHGVGGIWARSCGKEMVLLGGFSGWDFHGKGPA